MILTSGSFVVDAAKGGDVAAAKEVLTRACGRAEDAENAERLEQLERTLAALKEEEARAKQTA